MFPEFALIRCIVSQPEADSQANGYTMQIRWGRLAVEVTLARLPKKRAGGN